MVCLVGNSNYFRRTNDNKRSKHSSKIYAANSSRFFTLRIHSTLSTQSAVIENDFDNSNMLLLYWLKQTLSAIEKWCVIHNSLAISGVQALTYIYSSQHCEGYIWREINRFYWSNFDPWPRHLYLQRGHALDEFTSLCFWVILSVVSCLVFLTRDLARSARMYLRLLK